jgi:hypothetical protein
MKNEKHSCHHTPLNQKIRIVCNFSEMVPRPMWPNLYFVDLTSLFDVYAIASILCTCDANWSRLWNCVMICLILCIYDVAWTIYCAYYVTYIYYINVTWPICCTCNVTGHVLGKFDLLMWLSARAYRHSVTCIFLYVIFTIHSSINNHSNSRILSPKS